jgi:thioredoxin reductase (NADPH)
MSETPDTCGACPRLTQPQLAALGKLRQRRAVPPGGTLFAEGDRNCDFFAILDGTVAVVDAPGPRRGADRQRARTRLLPRLRRRVPAVLRGGQRR